MPVENQAGVEINLQRSNKAEMVTVVIEYV